MDLGKRDPIPQISVTLQLTFNSTPFLLIDWSRWGTTLNHLPGAQPCLKLSGMGMLLRGQPAHPHLLCILRVHCWRLSFSHLIWLPLFCLEMEQVGANVQQSGFQGGRRDLLLIVLSRGSLGPSFALQRQIHVHQNNAEGFSSYILWPCSFRLKPSAWKCLMHFEGEAITIQPICVCDSLLLPTRLLFPTPYSGNQLPSFSQGFLTAFAPQFYLFSGISRI